MRTWQRTRRSLQCGSGPSRAALSALCLALGVGIAAGRDEPSAKYVPAAPSYASRFDEPLIELRFELPASGGAQAVAVRLMRHGGRITQSFLVPGGHPYVSDGFLLEPQGEGWKGRIFLSREVRGGPARGMGTPRTDRLLEVELTRQGGGVAARCACDGLAVPVTATLLTWQDLAARSDPVDAGKSWPAWYGPTCNFAAEPSGHELVEDLAQARLVWKGQERFGSGKAQSPRYGVIPEDGSRLPLLPGGGGASPVVAGGCVFVSYFLPSGQAVDEELLRQRRQKAGADAEAPLPPWEPDLWRIAADDVVACMDARTGQTLWRTVYAGAGANWHDSKAGPCNVTPCLAGGKVYAIGSTGRVYCLDANTGREAWQSCIGPRHVAIEQAKAAAIQQRRYGKLTFSRDFGGTVTVMDGVAVLPDFTSTGACGLLALDAATGAELWRLPAAAAEDAVPLCFRHEGKSYVISGVTGRGETDPGRIVCVEPRTGKVRWTISEGIAGNGTVLSLWRNCLVVHAPAEGKPPADTKAAPLVMACYRITPDGFERRWALPAEQGLWKEHPPALADGFLYARLIGPKLLCVELATGKVVVSADYPLGAAGATMTLADGRLIVDYDGSHNHTLLSLFATDPGRSALVQLGEAWEPPHQHGTSYHPQQSHPYVDGRLFIRGADGVYCYDLRKPRGAKGQAAPNILANRGSKLAPADTPDDRPGLSTVYLRREERK